MYCSGGVLFRKLSRGHLERGMDTHGVVAVDGPVYFRNKFTERIEAIGVTKINFELVVEALLIPVPTGILSSTVG